MGAAQARELGGLAQLFYPLGDGMKLLRLREIDNRQRQCGDIVHSIVVQQKWLVDLEDVDWKALEVAETGMACPETIDHETHTERPRTPQLYSSVAFLSRS